MRKKESILPSSKEEKLTFENSFPRTGELVMTEILFSNKANFAVKQVILPGSTNGEVAIRTFSDPGVTIVPSFLSLKSESIVFNKIFSNGVEEKVIVEILVTETGKVIMRKLIYPQAGEKVLVKTIYPNTKLEVKTNVLFSSSGIVETKRIYFPSSGRKVI
jgi:hypothetical protein